MIFGSSCSRNCINLYRYCMRHAPCILLHNTKRFNCTQYYNASIRTKRTDCVIYREYRARWENKNEDSTKQIGAIVSIKYIGHQILNNIPDPKRYLKLHPLWASRCLDLQVINHVRFVCWSQQQRSRRATNRSDNQEEQKCFDRDAAANGATWQRRVYGTRADKSKTDVIYILLGSCKTFAWSHSFNPMYI